MRKLIEQLRQEIKNECGGSWNKLDPAFYERHLVCVEKHALALSEYFPARKDLLSVAAYVHDIAAIRRYEDLPVHHTSGALLAADMLGGRLPDEDIKLVTDMIVHHNLPVADGSPERIVFSHADSISKFDSPLFWISYGWKMRFSCFADSAYWYKEMIEKTYAMMIPQIRDFAAEKYSAALAIVSGEIV